MASILLPGFALLGWVSFGLFFSLGDFWLSLFWWFENLFSLDGIEFRFIFVLGFCCLESFVLRVFFGG